MCPWWAPVRDILRSETLRMNIAHRVKTRLGPQQSVPITALRLSYSMGIDEGTVVVPATVGDVGSPRLEPEPTQRAEPLILAGRYRLTRRIGKGGMGEVIAARDEQVGRDVAVKRMRSAAPGEQAIRRFLREASIQGRLEHPAIVPVHELGRDDDGLPFFV